MFRREGDIMNYYDEIKNILVDNAIGRKVREYKSNQKDLENYYNVGKLLVEAQGGDCLLYTSDAADDRDSV